jgi:hypothetical protein
VLVEDQGGAGDAWRGETHVLAKAQRRCDMPRSLRDDGQELSGQRDNRRVDIAPGLKGPAYVGGVDGVNRDATDQLRQDLPERGRPVEEIEADQGVADREERAAAPDDQTMIIHSTKRYVILRGSQVAGVLRVGSRGDRRPADQQTGSATGSEGIEHEGISPVKTFFVGRAETAGSLGHTTRKLKSAAGRIDEDVRL